MTADIQARPTVYKGIQMRSRLEADYAAMLDSEGEEWAYEPTCFAGPDCQWLPDFRLKTCTYVEVKSAHLLQRADGESAADVDTRIDAILRQISVALLSEPDAVLELVFHVYGEKEPPLIVLRTPEVPMWLAFTAGAYSVPLIWPGMGQWTALKKTLTKPVAARKSPRRKPAKPGRSA